jgi:hypothetical protein
MSKFTNKTKLNPKMIVLPGRDPVEHTGYTPL